ncbi:hypothetical protein [Hydrobacter penzbergensis]|uniref:hypothetical protein n=1 Tax=Hydrobacter penzbergensis TaxID=1235997 RepID=UPI00214B65B1|nr:hypothetical protein [Hydrobacter penzbergensis]
MKVKGYISAETNDNPEAFLWIPPDCRQVRAVVVGQHNMCEETIFEHTAFRKTMTELGFAIVWISPGIDQQWDVKNGCQKVFDDMMNALADKSGYTELKYAPFIPLGHSAMATFPWNFAAWNPERTLAIISYHGDAPRTNLTGYGRENLEWGRNRNIDGIPGLMVEGEYEWWEARVNPALAFRMMYPESCISFLCDAGHGHFDVSDEVVDYLSLFIRKAAQYRLPQYQPLDEKVQLTKVDKKQGWLAERWHPGQDKRSKEAPFSSYKGDAHDAFWYFDKEMADATESYYARKKNKKPQYIGFAWQGQLLSFDLSTHAQYSITNIWPGADGITYYLSAAFTDSTHRHFSRVHATTKINIDRICGPVKKVNDTTFCIQFYRMGLNNTKRTNDIWLLAHNSGDVGYKSVVQQFNVKINYPLIEGKRQRIIFPMLKDVKKGTRSVKLNAIADSGLPVSYYVKEGPAEIASNELMLTAIPPRTQFPVKVTVVAWQYGIKGKIQSAEPVERTFWIDK